MNRVLAVAIFSTLSLATVGFASEPDPTQDKCRVHPVGVGEHKPNDQDDNHQGDQHQGDQHQGDQHQGDQHGEKPDKDRCDRDDDHHDHDRTPSAHFNLVCYYTNKDNPEEFRACKVASTFEKAVTLDGGEVADNSPDPTPSNLNQLPQLSVDCGRVLTFNDHARRFTGLLNTRIQALSGPHPAIVLPRGALHTGIHISESSFEVDHKDVQLRLHGECYIWTGRP